MHLLLLIPLLFGALRLPAQLQVAFNPSTATMAPGEERTFNLVASSGFTSLIGMQFTVVFDTNRFELTNAYPLVDTVVAFNGMGVSYYNGKDPQNSSGYGIKVLWFDISLSPKTLAAGTPLVAIRLKAKSAGTSQMNVICNPALGYDCEVLNSNDVNIGIQGQAANITVSGNVNGLTATVGKVTSPSGSNVCVPVTVNNFNDIALMEFGLTWNSSILTFTGLNNCNSALNIDCTKPEPGAGNPNTNFGFFNANTLQFSWFSLSGNNLPAGATLFELCFNVNGSAGQVADISFFANPNPNLPPKIEFRDSKDDIIPANTIAGSVTIGTSKTLKLDIDDRNACVSDTFCVPVRARDFKNIVGLQLYITADPTKVDLVSVKSCNPKLQLPSCTLGGLTFFESNDTLGFLFIDPDPLGLLGVTLNNDEALFQLCYQNKMAEGDSVEIKFTDKATANPPVFSEANDTSGLIGMTWSTGKIKSVPCNCNIGVSAALINRVTCNGGSNGSINLLVNGGSGNFSYVWNPTLPNNKNPMNLSAGTYKVTIVDNVIPNCTWVSGNLVVTQPPPFSITGAVTNETCAGTKDGSVALTISGSNPGSYSVNWGGGLTGATINGLSAGTYTATVTDSEGCNAVSPTFTVGSSSIGSSSVAKTNITCFGAKNGTISITLPSTGGPYTVTWSPSSAGTGPNLTNLGPGSYTPTVSNASGCSVTLEAVGITEPQPVSVTGTKTDVVCFGSPTGSITLNVTGGNGNFTYAWTGGLQTKDRSDLAPGSYSVTATDQNGCTGSASFTIANLNTAITLNSSVSAATTGQNNGSVTLSVSGGAGGYTYLWQPGNFVTKDLSGLASGPYTVTVTDAAGCTKTLNVTVPTAGDNVVTFKLSQFNQFNISCHGVCDGTAEAIAPGSAVNPVTFKWSANAGGGTSAVADKLCGGTYTVTITDATGKTFTGSTTLTAPAAWDITAQSAGEPPFAAAFVTVSGPLQQPYEFLWSNGETTGTINNLTAGNYCVTVTNTMGCSKTACVEIFDMECLKYRAVLTPDGDNLNDLFVISCVQDQRYMDNTLEIYNRWGQLVYRTENYQNDWAGLSQGGVELPEGTYFFALEYRQPFSEPELLKGSIDIIR